MLSLYKLRINIHHINIFQILDMLQRFCSMIIIYKITQKPDLISLFFWLIPTHGDNLMSKVAWPFKNTIKMGKKRKKKYQHNSLQKRNRKDGQVSVFHWDVSLNCLRSKWTPNWQPLGSIPKEHAGVQRCYIRVQFLPLDTLWWY